MIGALARLWRENRLIVSGFVLALAVTLFFLVRMVMFWVYWGDSAHRDQMVQGWMTPRYVAHSWRVPPEVVGKALGVKPGSGRITLAELASQRGTTVDALATKLMATIDTFRLADPDWKP